MKQGSVETVTIIFSVDSPHLLLLTLLYTTVRHDIVLRGQSKDSTGEIYLQNLYFLTQSHKNEGPVEANPAGESRSFFFTVGLKSVSFYRFKLVCLISHMAVK